MIEQAPFMLANPVDSTARTKLLHRFQIGTAIVLGAVLLFAAAMKAYFPLSPPGARAEWLSSPWVTLLAIEAEIVIGLWLLSGQCRLGAWYAALICFSIFSVVTLFQALSGAESCGCFGGLHTSPWLTLTFDVVAVAALIALRPRAGHTMRAVSRPGILITSVMAFFLMLSAGWLAFARMPKALSAEDGLTVQGKLVLLEPKDWIGKEFPLTGYVDIGSGLSTGRWLVMLYHADCPVCQEAMPQIGRMAPPESSKTALVEMPPYRDEAKSLTAPYAACVTGKLSDTKEWFATSPVVILLDDGVVRDVSEGKNVVAVSYDARQHRLVKQ
jgi:hypothetical protein